jgi:hypothetical protein
MAQISDNLGTQINHLQAPSNMTDFVSDVQRIPYSAERVFSKLSDLNNLGSVQSMLPQDKIKEFTFDTDSCSFQADTIGKISIRIVEREPFKTIKLVSEKSPVPFTCWIQLVEAATDDTRLKLTIGADIPFFFKGMIVKPLEEGIKKVAEALAKIPY